MSLPSTPPDDASLDRPAPARGAISKTRPFYWSVRREIWENRSLYIAPIAVAGLFLFAFCLSLIGFAHRRLALLALDASEQARTAARPYDVAATAVVLTTLIVAIAYCLGALHGERRDRSILFWKSLPVSDLTTVLAKAFIPLAVLPAIAFVVTVGLQIIMLAVSSAVLLAGGTPITPATQVPLFSMTGVLFYGLVISSLWWAPLYGWFLLVSGWARRVPFLWAFLSPLALCLVEKVAFSSTHFAKLIGRRLVGGYSEAFAPSSFSDAKGLHGLPGTDMPQIDPVKFLSSPDLWIGLFVAAGLLAAAVWLRHRRQPI
jgi:ABC-2 type transport system permease protein